jgi:hypothetical protein
MIDIDEIISHTKSPIRRANMRYGAIKIKHGKHGVI